MLSCIIITTNSYANIPKLVDDSTYISEVIPIFVITRGIHVIKINARTYCSFTEKKSQDKTGLIFYFCFFICSLKSYGKPYSFGVMKRINGLKD
ncbi:hypothetical protein D3C86_1228770 [compost metagenome]